MKLIYCMIAVAWYGFISHGITAYENATTFRLRMTAAQAQQQCPTPLISMYEKLHADQYFACDDGKNTTVLIFSEDKAVAIMDLKYFAAHEP